jgi:hypothetical protein
MFDPLLLEIFYQQFGPFFTNNLDGFEDFKLQRNANVMGDEV